MLVTGINSFVTALLVIFQFFVKAYYRLYSVSREEKDEGEIWRGKGREWGGK